MTGKRESGPGRGPGCWCGHPHPAGYRHDRGNPDGVWEDRKEWGSRPEDDWRRRGGSDAGRRQGNRGGEHIRMAVRSWQEAFETACREVQVEILKEKIRKDLGRRMGVIADAVIALMKEEPGSAREKKLDDLAQKIAEAYSKTKK